MEKEEIDVQRIQKLVYLLIQRFDVSVQEMFKLASGKSMKKSANQKKEQEKWEIARKKLQEFELLKDMELEEKEELIDEKSMKTWFAITIGSFCNLCELIK